MQYARRQMNLRWAEETVSVYFCVCVGKTKHNKERLKKKSHWNDKLKGKRKRNVLLVKWEWEEGGLVCVCVHIFLWLCRQFFVRHNRREDILARSSELRMAVWGLSLSFRVQVIHASYFRLCYVAVLTPIQRPMCVCMCVCAELSSSGVGGQVWNKACVLACW